MLFTSNPVSAKLQASRGYPIGGDAAPQGRIQRHAGKRYAAHAATLADARPFRNTAYAMTMDALEPYRMS
ncbi:MAG: hypothetical protein AAFP24_12300 [Pseudomonadota bacterium]